MHRINDGMREPEHDGDASGHWQPGLERSRVLAPVQGRQSASTSVCIAGREKTRGRKLRMQMWMKTKSPPREGQTLR